MGRLHGFLLLRPTLLILALLCLPLLLARALPVWTSAEDPPASELLSLGQLAERSQGEATEHMP